MFTVDVKQQHNLGDGLYKLEASDQILIVQSVHLYVIVFRYKYCLNQQQHNNNNKNISLPHPPPPPRLVTYYWPLQCGLFAVVSVMSAYIWARLFKSNDIVS